jgi:hypothetical protein
MVEREPAGLCLDTSAADSERDYRARCLIAVRVGCVVGVKCMLQTPHKMVQGDLATVQIHGPLAA